MTARTKLATLNGAHTEVKRAGWDEAYLARLLSLV